MMWSNTDIVSTVSQDQRFEVPTEQLLCGIARTRNIEGVCVCRLMAASTHRRFLACPRAGHDPCVWAFLLEVQQQRSTDLQTQLLPHNILRTGYLRCQPCGKASEATKRRQAVEQPTVHPRGRYQRQARKNRSNHGHAF